MMTITATETIAPVRGNYLRRSRMPAWVAAAAAVAILADPLLRAQDGAWLVADFDAGKVETVRGLAIVPMGDEQIGGTSTARFAITRPGARGSAAALRISFHVTGDFPAPFAGAWALLGDEGLAADLSGYRGVRFFARSAGGSYLAGLGQFTGQTAFFAAPFDVKPEWTMVELPFDRFRRAAPTGAPLPNGAAPSPTGIVSITFNVTAQRGDFDLDIDQVEVYR